MKKPTGSVTLFAFDEGQGLKEHTVPFDALVYILKGDAEITITRQYALKALQRFKMILTRIRS